MSVILRGAAAAFQSPTDLSRQTRYTQFNRSQPPPANARQTMAVIVKTPRPASRFGRRLGGPVAAESSTIAGVYVDFSCRFGNWSVQWKLAGQGHSWPLYWQPAAAGTALRNSDGSRRVS